MKTSSSISSVILVLSFFSFVILNAQIPVTNTICSNLGVESGWGAWKAATGDFIGGNITFNATNLSPVTPRFNLTSGVGFDVCTPNSPRIPVVASGFGNASIQLGQIQTNGNLGGCNSGCIEQLTFPLTVTAQDTNFTFAYAIVMEDAGHTVA